MDGTNPAPVDGRIPAPVGRRLILVLSTSVHGVSSIPTSAFRILSTGIWTPRNPFLLTSIPEVLRPFEWQRKTLLIKLRALGSWSLVPGDQFRAAAP